jgi:predicted kinase
VRLCGDYARASAYELMQEGCFGTVVHRSGIEQQLLAACGGGDSGHDGQSSSAEGSEGDSAHMLLFQVDSAGAGDGGGGGGGGGDGGGGGGGGATAQGHAGHCEVQLQRVHSLSFEEAFYLAFEVGLLRIRLLPGLRHQRAGAPLLPQPQPPAAAATAAAAAAAAAAAGGAAAAAEDEEDAENACMCPAECWSAFVERAPSFPARFAAYAHYRRLGWVVRSAHQYGAAFALYRGSPDNAHASSCVLLHRPAVVPDELQWQLPPPRPSWRELQSHARLMVGVAKDLLLCTVGPMRCGHAMAGGAAAAAAAAAAVVAAAAAAAAAMRPAVVTPAAAPAGAPPDALANAAKVVPWLRGDALRAAGNACSSSLRVVDEMRLRSAVADSEGVGDCKPALAQSSSVGNHEEGQGQHGQKQKKQRQKRKLGGGGGGGGHADARKRRSSDSLGGVRMLVLVGLPGAGKSTLAAAFSRAVPGWETVNQDALGSRATCVSAAARILAAGGRVVVDRVNATPQQRAVWVQAARRHGIGSSGVAVAVLHAPSDICVSRVKARAEHPNLCSSTPADTIAKAVGSFEQCWAPPAAPGAAGAPYEEGFDNLVALDATLPAEELARRLQLALCPAASDDRQ